MITKFLASGCMVLMLTIAKGQKPNTGTDPTHPVKPGFLTISDANTMMFAGFAPGEIQSTVIPPGKKAECPNGRLLISNDVNFSLTTGAVEWRDLDLINPSNSNSGQSIFEPIPFSTDLYKIGSNDHDIVTFSNGDVLYTRKVWFRLPLRYNAEWFNVTYRIKFNNDGTQASKFGPGARMGVAVWRSTDGGKNFKFVSIVDPALIEDGSGALPKFMDTNKFPGGKLTTAPGTVDHPVYDMAGTDGQLTKINLSNNKVYITIPCFGNKQKNDVSSHFELSNKSVDRTIVVESDDYGNTWKSLGFMPVEGRDWRCGIATMKDDLLAFSRGNSIVFAHKQADGKYSYPEDDQWSTSIESNGYEEPYVTLDWKSKTGGKYIAANIISVTTMAQFQGGKLALVYPVSSQGAGGYSKLYFYDRNHPEESGYGPDIKPLIASPNCFIMHPTFINTGNGPLLLYWYDVNLKTLKVMIRGRIISQNGTCSYDFVVSRTGGMTRTFNLSDQRQWFGDYMTAGGLVRIDIKDPSMTYYEFYPIWVEPDNNVHFAKITCKTPIPDQTIRNTVLPGQIMVKPEHWLKGQQKKIRKTWYDELDED